MSPARSGCTVSFRVFDVDDPFDQLYACDPGDPGKPCVGDVGLIDSNTSGPDNRPTPEGSSFASATTDENGKAGITLTVSMQPGNNYRAAASVIHEAVETQIDQGDADALGVTAPANGPIAQMVFDDSQGRTKAPDHGGACARRADGA